MLKILAQLDRLYVVFFLHLDLVILLPLVVLADQTWKASFGLFYLLRYLIVLVQDIVRNDGVHRLVLFLNVVYRPQETVCLQRVQIQFNFGVDTGFHTLVKDEDASPEYR